MACSSLKHCAYGHLYVAPAAFFLSSTSFATFFFRVPKVGRENLNRSRAHASDKRLFRPRPSFSFQSMCRQDVPAHKTSFFLNLHAPKMQTTETGVLDAENRCKKDAKAGFTICAQCQKGRVKVCDFAAREKKPDRLVDVLVFVANVLRFLAAARRPRLRPLLSVVLAIEGKNGKTMATRKCKTESKSFFLIDDNDLDRRTSGSIRRRAPPRKTTGAATIDRYQSEIRASNKRRAMASATGTRHSEAKP